MKLYKFIIFFLFLFGCLIVVSGKNVSIKAISPYSEKNNYLTQLNYALNMAKIKTDQTEARDFQNEVEFYIINDNKKLSKVVFSTDKDPFWQVASLQQILRIAKIKSKDIKFIDLSIEHPYATFENN